MTDSDNLNDRSGPKVAEASEALERRNRLIDQIVAAAPISRFDSARFVREDRDAR